MFEIIKLTPIESEYWNRRNHLVEGYCPPKTGEIQTLATVIAEIEGLIRPRLDREERYFTCKSDNHSILMYRDKISEHFAQEELLVSIKRGILIFVSPLR